MSELRLDTALVRAGHASGREKAKELIAAGVVTVNGRVVSKASMAVREEDCIQCAAPPPRYVGRGGYKLEKALAHTGLSLTGAVAMDIGASTGGFTDCMLQSGASRVYAVDVGHDQLHPRLREDPRVVCLEGTDCRDTSRLLSVIPKNSITFCSVDVSFISLQAVLPALPPLLSPEAVAVCLIKPQFEAGKAAVGKKGLVRDKRDHIRVLTEQIALFTSLNWGLQALTWSPITGGEGNIEYLAVLRTGQPHKAGLPAPAAVADEAFIHLKTK